ncbi:zinc ribbon domain-containing protein [Candidatus Bathyarchaeota archaeon]|nr:zinc ribbon domain-containing protein [Candidatus Bathyarchaeota archaeon]
MASLAAITTPAVRASDNPGVPLYLHHLPGNVTVSGVQTNQILNTTTLWGGTTEGPNLRYNVLNFTLYPAITSSMASVGPGSVVLWVTVSGAPGSLNATIYDASAAGQLAVVSTSQLITLNSSPTVPYKITLGFNINHTFTQSSTIKLSLTVFKVSQLYVWYDSANYQSALVIPVSNIPRITQVETFDANFTVRTSFSLNWTSSQRIVFLIIHVADPFGAYHVANATVTITDPASTTVFTGTGSSLTINPAAPSKLFAVSWPYSTSLLNGTYTIGAAGNDTAGDRASDSVSILITSMAGSILPPTNPPPTNPPPTFQPPNSSWPSLYWLIGSGLIAAIIAALLALLFLGKRRRVHCPKCHAAVDSKLENCPYCRTSLKQTISIADATNPPSDKQPNVPSSSQTGSTTFKTEAVPTTTTPPPGSGSTISPDPTLKAKDPKATNTDTLN